MGQRNNRDAGHAWQRTAGVYGPAAWGCSMKRNIFATQGACIVAALKRKPHTYGDMHALGLSTSPQKRVVEFLDQHPELQLDKGKRSVNGQELVTWRVKKVQA